MLSVEVITSAQAVRLVHPVAGSPYRLVHRSDRGACRPQDLRLLGPDVPPSLVAIDVEARFATRTDLVRLAPVPGLRHQVDAGADTITVRRWSRRDDLGHPCPSPSTRVVAVGAAAPAPAILGAAGWSLDVVHHRDPTTGRVTWGDGRAGGAPPAETLADGSIAVVDDRGIRHRFDAAGRHLGSDDSISGVVIATVTYRPDGMLDAVVGRTGATTRIEVDAGEVRVVAADGRTTRLSSDDGSGVVRVTDAAGGATVLQCGPLGHVVAATTPQGRTHRFEYDDEGRLVRHITPLGGGSTLWRAITDRGEKVLRTTAGGVEQSSLVDRRPDGSRHVAMGCCAGAVTSTTIGADGAVTTQYADGTTVWDRRPAPGRPGSRVLRTPAGLGEETSVEREIVVDHAGWTTVERLIANGRTFTCSTDTSVRSQTTVTPEGRWLQVEYDAHGDIVAIGQSGRVPGAMLVRPVVVEHREHRDLKVREVFADGSGQAFGYDADGHGTALVRPDGATHTFVRDGDGNLVVWRDPNGGETVAARDADGRVTSLRSAAGRSIASHFAPAGSVSHVIGSAVDGTSDTTTIARDAATRLVSLTRTSSDAEQAVAYGWDGPLRAGARWTGVLAATAGYRYGPDLRLVGVAVDGGPEDEIEYDRDGLVVREGPFRIERDAATGAVLVVTDGVARVELRHDERGRLLARSHTVAGRDVYRLELTYDGSGRVARREEHIGGAAIVRAYRYDALGQLVEVLDGDGGPIERYGYDLNGNRISTERGPTAARVDMTYDGADHPVARDGAAMEVDADGLVLGDVDRRYEYGGRGELVAVHPRAGGEATRYVYDGFGTRVAAIGSSGTRRLLFADPRDATRLTCSFDASSARTRYRHGPDSLLAIERDGRRWHVACDQTGTARVVSDDAGTIVKVVERDSFGVVSSDSDPSFVLDVGFAGGIDDPASGRVRFGLRDYDARLGRWASADPLGFLSDDANLWRYCGNDPVNFRDPLGTSDGATTSSSGGFTLPGTPDFSSFQSWRDFSHTEGVNPTAPLLGKGAGDTTPAPGLVPGGTGFGFTPPSYGLYINGRWCQFKVGSGNIFPYPATPAYPGTTEYTDFGLEKGGSAGAAFQVHF